MAEVGRKVKKTSRKKLLIQIGVGSVFVIGIILIYIFFSKDDGYKSNMIDKTKDLVYTYNQLNTGTFSKEVPHVNLSVEKVNEDIDSFVNSYLNKDDNIINYKYNVSNNILSVVVRIISFDSDSAPINYFRSYNIDLNSLKLISNDELLNYFKIKSDVVQNKIEKQFKEYYYDLVVSQLVDEAKCNLTCFIKRRGFMGFMQDINYYVEDNNLIVYKPFIINSSVWEYEYFKDEDFVFKIT